MKNYLFPVLSLISLLMVINFGFAQQFESPESVGEGFQVPTGFFGCFPTDSLAQCMMRIFAKILRIVMVLAIGLAAIMFAWAGILYVTQGEGAKEKAKNKIIYAAIGLVVALLSWVITAFLKGVVTRGNQPL